MVLGKLPVPGGPTNLDKSGARVYCAYIVGAGGGCLEWVGVVWTFFIISLFFLPALYGLKYCLKGQLNPKQPTFCRCQSKKIVKIIDCRTKLIAWYFKEFLPHCCMYFNH